MFVAQTYFYVVAICLVAILMRRFRAAGFSLFEPGVTFGAFILAYSVIPLTAFAVFDDIFTDPHSDARLRLLDPSIDNVISLGWLHLWFFVCFTVTYLVIRIHGRPLEVRRFRASDLELTIGVSMLVGSKALVWAGMRYFEAANAEDYLATYTRLHTLPLLARQVLTHLSGLALTCSILLCVGLMSRREYRWLLPLWLVFEGTLLLSSLGSRTSMFVIGLAAIASYHYLVRRISTPLVLTTLGLSFLAFMTTGAYRDLGSGVGVGTAAEFFRMMFIRNEFTSIFINALDLQRLRDAGLTDSVFPQAYLSDIVNTVPQQLLPFEKLDLSNWYVQTFYPEYAARGGGLVFGIISEAVIGHGYPEATLRATLLGVLLAAAHICVATQKRKSIWSITFYIWLLVLSFKLFRGTTLALVPVFVLDFLPAYVVFVVIHAVARELFGVARQRAGTLDGRSQRKVDA